MPPRRAAESLLLSFDEGQEGGIDGGQRGFEPRQPCGVGIHQDRMGAALRAKTGDFGTVAAADIGDQDDPGKQLTRGTVASTAQLLVAFGNQHWRRKVGRRLGGNDGRRLPATAKEHETTLSYGAFRLSVAKSGAAGDAVVQPGDQRSSSLYGRLVSCSPPSTRMIDPVAPYV
jgi:hypothetical protein